MQTLADLFTREALRPFQPRPGADGLTPMLEVHTATQVVLCVLAMEDFDEGEVRREVVRGLGVRCAQALDAVQYVRFGAEAWMRTFTPDEYAQRQGRAVETYPDKVECIIVFGQSATGEVWTARALVFRRADGTIERVGPWDITDQTMRTKQPLLDAFWEGYRQGKGRAN